MTRGRRSAPGSARPATVPLARVLRTLAAERPARSEALLRIEIGRARIELRGEVDVATLSAVVEVLDTRYQGTGGRS